MATGMRDDDPGREYGPDADQKRRIRKQKDALNGLHSDCLRQQVDRVARRQVRVTSSDYDDQR